MSIEPTPLSPALAALSEDANASGVTWGAILAGAAAAAALTFILLMLGMGLGLSSVSPYEYNAAPAAIGALLWIAFVQLAASGLGGYLAGRLRVKWSSIHNDEVYFRDTAHGLLTWCVATLVAVALLGHGTRLALGGAGEVAAPAMAAAAQGAMQREGGRGNGPGAYYADLLLRASGADPASDSQRAEIERVVAASLARGQMNADDRRYLGEVVARRTGTEQGSAEQRVDQVYAQAVQAMNDAMARAKAAADEARKSAAHFSLWMFVALLLGAFVASLAATWGGRSRDHMRVLIRHDR